jgi:hypothetical protein
MHRMATYKRRIVYLSDEEWRMVGQIAEQRGRTISGHIRALLKNWGDSAYKGDDLPPGILLAEASANAAVAIDDMSEAYRSINSRPFTPVPKKGK